MGEWSFLVPPDITVTLRAPHRPRLLARCLGDQAAPAANSMLLLDLSGEHGTLTQVARGRYKGIPWRAGITVAPEGLALLWRSPLLREYLALHVVLLPALRRLLLERDIALVGGAAFELEGAATVLSGDTGAGKTAALLIAVGHGARLIGDEYVGVSATGDVTPVLRVLALRRATLADVPEFSRRLSLQRRAALRASVLATLLTVGRLDPLIHASPDELGLSTTSGAPTREVAFYWLERRARSAPRREPIDRTAAIDTLARAQALHDHAYGVPDALSCEAARWAETLHRGLAGVRCERLSMPHAPQTGDVLAHLLGAQPEPVRPAP